ncbi:hypothetical protein [Pantoea vagans]|uniref:hypothetical protein n=1 Tax=Pantoea vagans TaxID=470934 RepID=UPI0032096FA6
MEFYLANLSLKAAMENPASLRAALAGLSENLKALRRHSTVFWVRVLSLPAVLLLCGCVFHRHGYISGGQTISVSLTTADPYGPYARSVRRELRLDGIKVLRGGSDVTAATVSVDLVSSLVGSNTASILINGSTADMKWSWMRASASASGSISRLY